MQNKVRLIACCVVGVFIIILLRGACNKSVQPPQISAPPSASATSANPAPTNTAPSAPSAPAPEAPAPVAPSPQTPSSLEKAIKTAERLLDSKPASATAPKPSPIDKSTGNQREKVADLRADIAEIESRIAIVRNDLANCKEAMRRAWCRDVFLFAEKGKKIDESQLAELEEQLKKKKVALNNAGS